ncbi:MobC family plasmid mobilization relaxosome protein [Actinacidiphila acididurans]|uniref:MobC family plasmid mobilization relaxosome protein n=1 Tax=Actinacidiphila acididurans TaxID=2784346 RepID=A0ABS2U1X3_9ACTN|nr:MobC family plasmid mobilization relaxosome protein [Actinacidiphila acididurans]MBM9508520.1 MobC family plasmid mobilization relaxosome protein [Actinacidiphila acididurans]
MYRKRTSESRTEVKSIRFSPTAIRVIDKAADDYRKYFAGFVGDAAYAIALGRTSVTSPDDDPFRPLVERLERLIAQLRRVGNNLNQVARAVNTGTIPEHADRILARVDTAVEDVFVLLDGFADSLDVG